MHTPDNPRAANGTYAKQSVRSCNISRSTDSLPPAAQANPHLWVRICESAPAEYSAAIRILSGGRRLKIARAERSDARNFTVARLNKSNPNQIPALAKAQSEHTPSACAQAGSRALKIPMQ
ncbi:MAG: hypothetical protein DBX55_09705 [Verrucomicrobia bacterium]|nr:MAG: hypothetical protein DBX55_09705 [Verrucomicrobiota bacterium]